VTAQPEVHTITRRIKHAVSNGDPVNDWKRIIIAGLTLATLVVSAWNNSKLSSVQTEARTAVKAASQAVEVAERNAPTPTPRKVGE
jgi:ribosomal protein S20